MEFLEPGTFIQIFFFGSAHLFEVVELDFFVFLLSFKYIVYSVLLIALLISVFQSMY